MMEIKFTAYTWEELQLAAEFMKRLADIQQHRLKAENVLKDEYAKQNVINKLDQVGESRPGAVLGGMPSFAPFSPET